MRNFQALDQATANDETGILLLSSSHEADGMERRVSMRREGSYLVISASYGPLEIAMRLRYEELKRVLSRLHPVEGLQTTRQVGTGQAYISLGLQQDGDLVVRPTIVADATGHITLNFIIKEAARQGLLDWLPMT